MRGAAPRFITAAAALAVVGAAAAEPRRAEADRRLPAEIWAVELDSATAGRIGRPFLSRLRGRGINTLVVDPVRVGRARADRLSRLATRSRLLVLEVRTPRAALAPSVDAALRLARSRRTEVVVVRLAWPGQLPRLRAIGGSRIVALVGSKREPRAGDRAWQEAIRIASSESGLDLGLAPSGAAVQPALDGFLGLVEAQEKSPAGNADPPPSGPAPAPTSPPAATQPAAPAPAPAASSAPSTPAPSPAPADTQAPTAPSGLAVGSTTTSSIAVSWAASADDVGVAGYGVHRDGSSLGDTSTTAYTFTGLACGTAYTLAVDAADAAGNRSAKASLSAATSACPASAASVFVSPTGSDANPCTQLAPCLTFNRAYRLALPGQVVEVAGGSYGAQKIEYDAAKTSADDVVFQPAFAAIVDVSYNNLAAGITVYGASHLTIKQMKVGKLNVLPNMPSCCSVKIGRAHV